MKNTLRKFLLIVTGSVLLLLASQASAVMLSLQPSIQYAEASDVVSLSLVIDGLTAGGADSLGDFDIDIAFDTGALSFLGYSLGSMLGDLGMFEAVDFSLGDMGGGFINVFEVSLLTIAELDALQPSSFVLATFDFMVDVLDPGSSTTVAIDTVWALGDASGMPLQIDSLGDAVIANKAVGVPEPGIFGLLALGLLGMFYSQRRSYHS